MDVGSRSAREPTREEIEKTDVKSSVVVIGEIPEQLSYLVHDLLIVV